MGKTSEPLKLKEEELELPSDRITLGQMRRLETSSFWPTADDEERAADIQGYALHRWETILAEKAFAAAVGQPEARSDLSRREIEDLLESGYRLYGLSSGIEQTREMMRRIETAAVQQAWRGRSGR